MIAGERDPTVLAQMARSRIRAKIPQLEEALSVHFGAHHATFSREIIDHIRFPDATIVAPTTAISNLLIPCEAALTILCSNSGSSEITARS